MAPARDPGPAQRRRRRHQSGRAVPRRFWGNDNAQLQRWLPKLQEALKRNPKLRDVGTDVDNAGLRQNIVINRAQAARLGVSINAIDGALYGAFGQRQISTIYSDLNQYSVVVNALPEQTATPAALDRIYVPAQRRDGAAHRGGAPGAGPGAAADHPSEPVHDDGPELQPGAGREHRRRRRDHRCHRRRPAHARRHPHRRRRRLRRGIAAEFDADPGTDGDRGGLHRAGHAVREPGAPGDDPVHTAGRGHGRAAGAVGHRHRAVGDLDDRAGAADRHRQEERDHDDRLRPGRRARARQVAAGGGARGLRGALPPDHDDHDGGDPGRGAAGGGPGRRRGAAPPAGHRDDRRPADLAEPDPAQYAGAVRDLLLPARALEGAAPLVGERTSGTGHAGDPLSGAGDPRRCRPDLAATAARRRSPAALGLKRGSSHAAAAPVAAS
ncbi:efflux RND transporter permease subunit [Xanthomonas translucens pv. translucens]|nr:efflux RND transporter permease subunit [Xanthomonas translucens pv. translucens]